MKHYWNEEIDENFMPELFLFNFKNKKYEMYSSDGVFSKKKADEGSLILTGALLEELSNFNAEVNYPLSGKTLLTALDVGCGNALISILLALDSANLNIDLIDISDRAIKLSQINIDKYNLNDRLRVFKSDKYSSVDNKYDIIFTNPPIRTGKENVYNIFEGSFDKLNSGGSFYVVIRKSHGAPSALKKLKLVFGNCEIIKKSKGFYVLKSSKY